MRERLRVMGRERDVACHLSSCKRGRSCQGILGERPVGAAQSGIKLDGKIERIRLSRAHRACACGLSVSINTVLYRTHQNLSRCIISAFPFTAACIQASTGAEIIMAINSQIDCEEIARFGLSVTSAVTTKAYTRVYQPTWYSEQGVCATAQGLCPLCFVLHWQGGGWVR
jgi:hypothetical protein